MLELYHCTANEAGQATGDGLLVEHHSSVDQIEKAQDAHSHLLLFWQHFARRPCEAGLTTRHSWSQ